MDDKELRSFRRNYERSDTNIATLCNQLDNGEINLNPDFQRHYVWPVEKASKLIESIILNIPIPTVYLVEVEIKEEDYESLDFITKESIDGTQRLTSVYRYVNNEFALTGLETLSSLNGKKYEDLSVLVQNWLNRFTLTIITFDNDCDPNMKYQIFARYNQGSEKLTEQETRNCIFRGYFNDQIKRLKEENELVRGFFNEYNKDVDRMEVEEIILRGLARLNFEKMVSNIDDKDKAKYKIKVSKTMQLQDQLNVFINMYKDNKDEVDFMIQEYLDILQLVNDVLGKDIVKRSSKATLVFKYDVLLLAFKDADKEELLQYKSSIKEKIYEIANKLKAGSGNSATQKNAEKKIEIVKDAIEKGVEYAIENPAYLYEE